MPVSYHVGRWSGTLTRVSRATILSIAAACLTPLVFACSASTSGSVAQTEVPDDRDHDICALLCEKQSACAGLEITDTLVGNCAHGCFRNLVAHPYLRDRLRATATCVDVACGEFDACTARAQAGDEAPPQVPTRADRAQQLSSDECKRACTKTFECLGTSSMTSDGMDGCTLGCVHAASTGGAAAQKYRHILTCADVPCGEGFQRCLKSPPSN